MATNSLIPLTDDLSCPFLCLDNSVKHTYKIYNDGSHYVGTLCRRPFKRVPQDLKPSENRNELTDERKEKIFQRVLKVKRKKMLREGKCFSLDNQIKKREKPHDYFNDYFLQAVQSGIRLCKDSVKKFVDYIKPLMAVNQADYDNFDKYLTERVEHSIHSFFNRVKRFKRKAYLNRWNYFVTFTYDGNKNDEEQFRSKLRKCLSNLHTRRGWKYMGVFERAPETGRLHFHGLIYVPVGEMVGEISEKQDYSKEKHQVQLRHENDFFSKRFGVNDFQELSDIQVKRGQAVDYILKYIGKTGDRIVYSRDIPTEICMKLDLNDIATNIESFVTKYVLFDDVVDWERDVLMYRHYHQMNIDDLHLSSSATA
jgi:hypothetical protein